MPWLSRAKLREAIYQRELQRFGRVPCYVCQQHVPRAQASLEHILPRSLGGTNARRNLAISHRACNSRRGNKLLAHRAAPTRGTTPVATGSRDEGPGARLHVARPADPPVRPGAEAKEQLCK